VDQARTVGRLLVHDTMLLGEERGIVGAVRSLQPLHTAGRSIGAEPAWVSQGVRAAIRVLVFRSLERLLAQTEPPAEALRSLQRRLQEDERDNLLLFILRGERAGNDRVLEALQDGRLSLEELFVTAGMAPNGPAAQEVKERLSSPGGIKTARAELLRGYNAEIKIAEFPPHQRQAALDSLRGFRISHRWLFDLLNGEATSPVKMATADQRSRAGLRCAVCALAAERFRQANGRWPKSLRELVDTGLLDEVPLDPFDGNPIRLASQADGLIIYTVGHDTVDNGGVMDRKNPLAEGSDWGFQLWDVNHRRQPAASPGPRTGQDK